MCSKLLNFILAFICVGITQSPGQTPSERTPLLQKATTPQYAGTFHPRTGLVRELVESRFGPELIYNNSILLNYYSIPGALQEWIDDGTLPQRNQNGYEQVSGLNFTYCSFVPDASQNSVSSVFRLYSENVYCTGPPNWPTADCAYSISGLPGGDANGVLQCWLTEVSLSGGFECNLDAHPNSGFFGWSNAFGQNDTGPWLASGGVGNLNAFTWFDPTAGAGNQFVGCQSCNGGPPTCSHAGFATQLYGNPTEVFSLAIGVDDPGRDMYLQVSNQALVGGSVSVTAHAFDQTQIAGTRLLVSTSLDMNGLQIPGIGGIHVGRGASIRYDQVSQSGTHDFNSIPIQGTFYMQAAVESSPNQPIRLSNVMQVNVL